MPTSVNIHTRTIIPTPKTPHSTFTHFTHNLPLAQHSLRSLLYSKPQPLTQHALCRRPEECNTDFLHPSPHLPCPSSTSAPSPSPPPHWFLPPATSFLLYHHHLTTIPSISLQQCLAVRISNSLSHYSIYTNAACKY